MVVLASFSLSPQTLTREQAEALRDDARAAADAVGKLDRSADGQTFFENLDAAKGAVAVLIARALAGEDAAQLAALASFLGHLFPVWLGFRGGKGVATFLGTLLALAWPIGLMCCAAWVAMVLATRISSASALVATVSAALWLWIWGPQEMIALALALAALVWLRHAANIRRLLSGTEPRVGH